MRDPESGNSRGFGFISYDSFEASDAAIEVFVLCWYFHILQICVRNMRFNNTRFRLIISLLCSLQFIIYFLYLNWGPLGYSLMPSLTWSTIRLDLHLKKKKKVFISLLWSYFNYIEKDILVLWHILRHKRPMSLASLS